MLVSFGRGGSNLTNVKEGIIPQYIPHILRLIGTSSRAYITKKMVVVQDLVHKLSSRLTGEREKRACFITTMIDILKCATTACQGEAF